MTKLQLHNLNIWSLFALIILTQMDCTLTASQVCFKSLSLVEAESLVLQNNRDYLAMKQLVEKANQERIESFSKWMPEIRLISRGYKTERVQEDTDSKSAFISQVSLLQTLFSAKRYYNVKIANLEVTYLKLLLNSLAIDLLYDVRYAYYRLILDRQNIETARQNIEIFSDLVKQMESSCAIGTSILLDVNQSKVATASATSAYYEAIKVFEIDADRLATLLGYCPGSVVFEIHEEKIPIESIPDIAVKVKRLQQVFHEGKHEIDLIYKPGFPSIEKKLMQNLFSEEEFTHWERTAFSYRPEIYLNYTQMNIANQQVCKSKGEYYPSISLQLNYGGYPTNIEEFPSSKLTNQNFDWAIGLSFDWLLYDGWGRTSRINQAKFNRNAKCQQFKKSIQELYENVRKEIFTIEESVANYVTAEGNVKLSKQTLALAKRQLDIGYITIFDYQRVVDEYILAINKKNEARFQLIIGYYGLKRASGTDLKNFFKNNSFRCPN